MNREPVSRRTFLVGLGAAAAAEDGDDQDKEDGGPSGNPR